MEVSHDRSGGDNDDFAIAKGVFDEVALVATGGTDSAGEKVVIERFGGDEHEGKVHGFFAGANVFAGFVNAGFEVGLDFASVDFPALFGFGIDHAVVVFERKFAVDGENLAFVQKDCGVDNLAVFETVLELVDARRENIAENGVEIKFAKDAALFGIAQDILEGLELVGNGDDVLVGLCNGGDTSGDFGDDAGGFVELTVGVFELMGDRLLDAHVVLIELVGHGFFEPGNLPVHHDDGKGEAKNESYDENN